MSSSYSDVCFHYHWVLSSLLTTERASGCLLMSRLISASILGPVFGNQDHFVGLAIFVDTFRNDLHEMDVSVECVTRAGHWPACFFAGPVFSNTAHFQGLAVFIDTYSNDEATDVSRLAFSCGRTVSVLKQHVRVRSMWLFQRPHYSFVVVLHLF